MPELEEPILSTLGRPNDVASTFMNAFYAASQINNRKRLLEEQLVKMQSQMTLAEEKHQLDMEKFGWQQQYQQANLQRAYDAMQATAVYKDRQASDAEKKANWYMSRKDAAAENAGQLRDELSTLIQKYPNSYGNQEFANELALVKSKYNTVIGTPEGARVVSDFSRDINNAQRSAHRSAAELHQNFNDTLNMIGKTKEFTLGDFMQPDSVWGRNPKTGERWIATDANGMRLTPDQVDKMNSQGVKFHTLPAGHYNHFKKMADRISEIGGDDPNEKPAMIHPDTEVTRNVNGRKAVFNSDTKQFVRWADE